ncbi:MAG: hypothetical protein IMZ55_09435 [Acidobacteria bacterium]|nr:hypothetical protein [Spirochaetota bacterium]MBE3133685.1 hypothetical protein [Acidobacteriota bacterium]
MAIAMWPCAPAKVELVPSLTMNENSRAMVSAPITASRAIHVPPTTCTGLKDLKDRWSFMFVESTPPMGMNDELEELTNA